MAERIAHGEVFIEVNDREALARLDKIRSEFNRTMEQIDREQATVEIDGNVTGLKKALKEAERDVKKFEAEAETAASDSLKATAKARAADAKARADQHRATLDQQKDQLAGQRQTNKEYALTEKRLRAVEKKNNDLARLAEKLHRDNIRRVNAESRVRESLNRQRVREEQQAERNQRLLERETREVPKLESAYARLIEKMQDLAKAKKKAFDDKSKFHIELSERETLAALDHLKTEIRRRTGRDPIEMEVIPRISERAGRRIRQEFLKGSGITGGLTFVAAALGADLGNRMGRGMVRTFRETTERGLVNTMKAIGAAVGGRAARESMTVFNRIGDAVKRIPDMSVRLGPFTTTMRGALVALSAFGPLLVDVVGGLGALVGSLGAATLGFGALTVGLLGGLIPAFGGFAFVIKDVVQEFGAIKKAQKAYDDTALKHGKNSEKAKTKMEELKNVMGGVTETTAKQVLSAQKLGDAWDTATSPARASVWKAAGEGIKTARVLMDDFAFRTNVGMKIAQEGVSKWMKAMRSPEGQRVLGEMMDNFNASLGPIMDGLGNIVGYLGRVGAIASRHLPGLTNGFADWARSLNSVSESDLEGKVNRMVDSAKNLGRFFMAAGRFVKAFFSTGREAGDGFIQTMTDALNRWTKLVEADPKKFSDFFKEAVSGTQSLYAALKPIISTFTLWSAALSPIMRGFLDIVGAVGMVIGKITALTVLRAPLTALGATLGTLWAVGKIGAAINAIQRFTLALLGMGAAQTAVARGSAVTAGAGIVGSLFGRGGPAAAAGQMTMFGNNVGKAGGKVGVFRAAATKLIPAIGSLGAIAGGAATLGVGALAAAAGYGVYKLFTMKSASEKLGEAIEENNKQIESFKEGITAIEPAWAGVDMASKGYSEASTSVEKLKKQLGGLKEGTARYSSVLAQLNGQLRARDANEKEVARALKVAAAAGQAGADAEREMVDVNNRVNEARARRVKIEDELQKMRDRGLEPDSGSMERLTEAQKNENDALRSKAKLQAVINKAHVAQNILGANNLRTSKEFERVVGDEARALSRLIDIAPKVGRAIARMYPDPRDVGRVSRAARAAIGKGVPRSVSTNVVANSGSAEAALRRLRTLTIPAKTMRVIDKGGQEALTMLTMIAGRKLSRKEQKIIMDGDGNVLARLAKIEGSNLARKVLKIMGNDDDARRVLARVNGMRPKELTQFIKRLLSNSGAEFPKPPTVTQWVRRQLANKSDANSEATGAGGSRAGRTPTASTASFMSRALDRASRGELPRSSGGQAARGMKVSGPRAIWGEEPQHPEFVLSTNPSYRKSNLRYLQQAAAAMGVSMSALGGVFTGGAPTFNKKGKIKGVSADKSSEFHPEATIQRPLSTIGKGKNRKPRTPFQSGAAWAGYIEGLHTQQGYWEREVGIRESQVREPEDWVIVTGKKEIKDEVTGETQTVETYGPNTPKIDEYKAGLAQVQAAITTLMSIILELVRAIPLAMQANKAERVAHDDAADTLQGKIKGRKNDKYSGEGAAAKRKKRDEDVAKMERRRDKHLEEIRTLKEDYKTLSSDRVEAGFDYREADIALAEVKRDYDNATGEGQKQADADSKSPTVLSGSGGSGGGGGTGGGGNDLPSRFGQMMMADSEMGGIAKGFSANAQAFAGAMGGAAGGAMGGGMQAGGANLSSPTTSGGAAAAAMAGGASAAGSLTPSTSGTQSGAVGTAGGETTIINNTPITNNFDAPPPDPHTFVKGVEFEIGSLV